MRGLALDRSIALHSRELEEGLSDLAVGCEKRGLFGEGGGGEIRDDEG